ncbi:MAG: hypothetical protein V3574_02265 [Candidatus Moraniibacteriota bacterium]
MINYTIAVMLVIAGIAIIFIGKPKTTVLLPLIGAVLLAGVALFVYQNWDEWKHPPKTGVSTEKNEGVETGTKASIPKIPEWETVGNFPIHFNGRIFSSTVGPNGERAGTAEIYTDSFVKFGYRYKISFHGDYSKYFMTDPWYNNISWRGWTPQNSNVKLPYPKHQNMSLVLRIGNVEGLHPDKKNDFIIFVPTEDAKIFAELNINREEAEYYHPKEGLKVKKSTLFIKLERQPI